IFFVAVIICVTSLILLSHYVLNYSAGRQQIISEPPSPTISCQGIAHSMRAVNEHTSDNGVYRRRRVDPRVLVFAETPYTQLAQDVVSILESIRLRYRLEVVTVGNGKLLPSLTHADRGRFSVIVFERLETYLSLDSWNRQLLDKYCRDYDVGVIAFAQPDETLYGAQVKDFPLFVNSKLVLRDYCVNGESPVLRITRAGETFYGAIPGDNWTVFIGNHSTYVPLTFAKLNPSTETEKEAADLARDLNVDKSASRDELDGIQYDATFVPAIEDRGIFDGVRRILFGNGFKFWLHRVLFIDSLSYLSHGLLSQSLDRYVLVDIDDIFVGQPGTRVTASDVDALLKTQTKLRKFVKNFTFNVGFSGKFFHHGTQEENEGDSALIVNRDQFWWFGHSYSHTQAHKFVNYTSIEDDMLLNQAFARLYDIPVNTSYAVAPHHSGVYPIHEELYEAWKQVWGIRVTSTEEYPHLRPARHRRGFIHRDMMVLPRQTCGLFTHTVFINKYPGGRNRLEYSIRGGELFQILLYNQVSVFMTHMSNYGNDRLAMYTFESVFRFINCWTNLRLQTVPPLELAQMYFTLYPDEKDAVWHNPCDDRRHHDIWSEAKSCDRLPDFIVIGPQKTGTTALYTFLSMHQSIVSNRDSDTTFEEVQFFNGKNYLKGLDWYLEHFPLLANGSDREQLLFEKSAGYFDSDVAPKRAYALLPRAKLVCILAHPAKRAYSWYQHMRSHQDPVALAHSFYDVITANSQSPRLLRDIRKRCLNPGLYAQHLERWLNYYDSTQLHIIDGEVLRVNPVLVMNRIQQFLVVEPFIDYSQQLEFNPRKGFFCQARQNATSKCLGSGKGRVYPPMDSRSEAVLKSFYRKPNIALSKLLLKLGLEVPGWLEQELSDIR
ncbi:unnamed protein product, partial [Sphagnum compactum]